ncbi:MAG: triose-phosphate isomerase [Candidatus Wallbacteria bacterium]|nr:triose-phosphate isomerase [Candidatus Wallbacteria bacterium]
MREKIFAANWKMNKTVAETEAFFQEFVNYPGVGRGHGVIVFPPATSLAAVRGLVGAMPIRWGAQNMYSKDAGAFTGEISGPMIRELGCSHVLIGHSERREIFRETDEDIREKVKAAHKHGLIPMLCVGETLGERKGGQAADKVVRQLAAALQGVPASEAARTQFAYEPIWAIGTGLNASSADAQEMCGLVRKQLAQLYSGELASGVPVLYGGSVKPENIAEYMLQPDIDGALIGGASLQPSSFLSIIKNAMGSRFSAS